MMFMLKTTEKNMKQDSSLESIRKDVLKQLEDGNSETARFADKITGKST